MYEGTSVAYECNDVTYKCNGVTYECNDMLRIIFFALTNSRQWILSKNIIVSLRYNT